ncbi:hypothetical protein NC651_026150 [Populus alba x Populus x berolinensis]|nr:hypothetical protein NC651_026150 [Populus alba x Populus x berolinensis]
MNKKKGRWWRLEADFFRGWFLIFPRFDRSYFFLSQLWLSLCLSLSLSFFFFASNGSGSARKEGGPETHSLLTHFPKEICAVFFGRQRLLSRLPSSTKPSYQHITRY